MNLLHFAQLLSTTTITKYVPPSDISLHFWWYPFIVIALVTTLFFGVSMGLGAFSEDTITMTLLGVIVGMFISYEMQLLPLTFVVFGLAGFILYLIRATA